MALNQLLMISYFGLEDYAEPNTERKKAEIRGGWLNHVSHNYYTF